MQEKIKLLTGDITQLKVDCIVNAANTSLQGGGGVDGAIHQAAGPNLLEECKKLEGCGIGQAKITKGFNLAAKFIIHTVGPVWRGGVKGEPQLLASCYESTLRLAVLNKVKTIAFPAISCGVYGYPISQAALIAIKETSNFLELNTSLETVYFVCFDQTTFDAYEQALSAIHHD